MDDDHAFSPSMLTKLLAHGEKLVMPICLTRVHPFAPVQYVEKIGEAQYLPIKLSDAETKGLVEVQAGGCAGMLIHRDVIETIEPPWFEYTDRSEDIVFCEKARANHFKLYADLEVTLGHITTAVVHPTIRDGEWKTGLTIGRDLNLIVDTADSVVAEKPGGPRRCRRGSGRSGVWWTTSCLQALASSRDSLQLAATPRSPTGSRLAVVLRRGDGRRPAACRRFILVLRTGGVMAGLVGVIANDTSRYSMFTVCLTSLRSPVNTMPEWALTSDRILGRNRVGEGGDREGSRVADLPRR